MPHLTDLIIHRWAVIVNEAMRVARIMSGPQICVSLDGTSIESITDESARANLAGADMVEVRFDRLYLIQPDPTISEEEEGEPHKLPPEDEWALKDVEEIEVEASISALRKALPLPVVFTVRPVSEGGFYPGKESQRLAILEAAIESDVSWIDLELSIDDDSRSSLMEKAKEKGVKIIASKHDTNGMPTQQDIIDLVSENQSKGDLVKFCGTSRDHGDALQIVNAAEELKDSGHGFSLMSLNNGGDWGRLHAPIFNQNLVYATMQNEFRLSDKGLVNIRDLKEAWTLLEY